MSLSNWLIDKPEKIKDLMEFAKESKDTIIEQALKIKAQYGSEK